MFGVEHVYQTCIVVLLGNSTNGHERIGHRPAFSWPTRSSVPRTKTCSSQSPIPEVYTRRSAKPMPRRNGLPIPGILFVVTIPNVSSQSHPALPWLRSRESVTTWPSPSIDIRIANGQLSSEQMKAVGNPKSPNKGDEGVRATVAGELSKKGQGCSGQSFWPRRMSPSPRVLTTILQPFPHLRPPPWLLPRIFVLTAVPFAVAKDIGKQREGVAVHPQAQPASVRVHRDRCTKLICVLGERYISHGDPDTLLTS